MGFVGGAFSPPAMSWLVRRELPPASGLRLGPGLDPELVHGALERIWALGGIQALVAFGSRARDTAHPDSDLDLAVILQQPQLDPEQKARCWARCREAMGLMALGWIWWWWGVPMPSGSVAPVGMCWAMWPEAGVCSAAPGPLGLVMSPAESAPPRS